MPLPGATVYQVDAEPFSISPNGFATWTSSAWTSKGRPFQSPWAVAWQEVESIGVADHDLRVNSKLVHRFSTRADAVVWAGLFEKLRDGDNDDREAHLKDFVEGRTNLEEVIRQLALARSATRSLRWTGAAQWLYMFVILPILLSQVGGGLVLLGMAAVLFGFVVVNTVLFVSAHRKLWPDERWKRVESAILMLLSWPMAARAADLVTRHHLSRFDPVAVALAMPGAVSRSDFIHHVVRDARHPLEMEPMAPEAIEVCRWQMQWSLDHRLRLVNSTDARLACADGSVETGARLANYCPRCLATYDQDTWTCSDCPGVRLRCVQDPKGG